MYKATATPGPKEKEIVELFRKVQAELRERAAKKEENKTDASEGGKENETVESLLSILRKNSSEQGSNKNSTSNNISSSSNSLDSVMEQRDQNAPFDEEEAPGLFNSNNSTRLEAQKTSHKPFRRPMSNFRRKSPVPRVKFQPVYSAEDDTGSNSSLNSKGRRKTEVDPDLEPILMPYLEAEQHSDSETEAEEMLKPGAFSVSSSVHNEVFTETSESDSSDVDEAYYNDVVETDSSVQQGDLSELKLSDLKELAKSRGLKGYSKLKKANLVELLSG